MQSEKLAAQKAIDDYEAILNSGSPIKTSKGYGNVAQRYDQLCADCEYTKAPQLGAVLCKKYVKNSPQSVILDIGAGTGALGYHLRKVENFQGQIDILDGSMDMLYQASQKGIEFRLTMQLLIDEEIPLLRNSYDVVTSVGALVPNHIPAQTLREFLALVKPGGFLIFNDEEAAGQGYLQELRDVVERLKNEGKMELVETTSVPQNSLGGVFVFYVFRKCC